MSESTDNATRHHHHRHHKSKGLNHENLRRNSFETSDNAPMYVYSSAPSTPLPPQYTLNPSPPGSFYTYATYPPPPPPQQGIIYPPNIPPVPIYNPYPQYGPLPGPYHITASPLEQQRDRLERFERLHEEQMERGITVEEAQAVDEAIQLSLLEAESMNNNTMDHTVDTTEYSTIHNSMRADDDSSSIYNDPIDIADNRALHEGIRLSLSEPTRSSHHSRSPSIISMLTDNLMYSKSHDDQDHHGEHSVTIEEHSVTNEEHSSSGEDHFPTTKEPSLSTKEHTPTTEAHSELNSETLQSTTDPSIQYKRKSSSFSLKKTATGIAHKCSSILNSAWHSMDRKDKHHTSASDSNSNDNNSNTAASMVYDDNRNSVISPTTTTATIATTPNPSNSSTILEDTTTTTASTTTAPNTDIINKSTVQPTLYTDTITPIKKPVHDPASPVTTSIPSTEPRPADNNNLPRCSTELPPLPPLPPRKSIPSTSPSAEIMPIQKDSTSTSSVSATSNSSGVSPTLSPPLPRHSKHPTRHSYSGGNIGEHSESHFHSAPLHHHQHHHQGSLQHTYPYASPAQGPVRYASPQYVPVRYMSPAQLRPPVPVPVPGPGRYVSPAQLCPPAPVPVPGPGRYVSPQQRRPPSVPLRYASPQYVPVRYASPSQLRPPVPVSGRYASPQQGGYHTTIPGAVAVPYTTPPQQQQRYMSPQQRL